MLTIHGLKKIIHYDKKTGIFTRKIPTSRVKVGERCDMPTHSKGYRRVTVEGKRYFAHRLAWFYMTGEMPNQIDHQNHIVDDNRFINLLNVTQNINHKNMKLYTKNKSGHHGVCFDKDRKKWYARLTYNGKVYNLGRYLTMEEAIKARLEKEKEMMFHENHGQRITLKKNVYLKHKE